MNVILSNSRKGAVRSRAISVKSDSTVSNRTERVLRRRARRDRPRQKHRLAV